MSYTLKANAINSAATFFFAGENGLVDLTASIAVTPVGTAGTTQTITGHTAYAYGSAGNNYLSATLAAIPASVPFCVLLVGRPSADANDTDFYVIAPSGNKFGTQYGPARMSSVLEPYGTINGTSLTGYSHPTAVQHIWMWGRKGDNTAWHGFNAAPGQVAGPSATLGTVTAAAGLWKFGGSPLAGTTAGFGVGICAVFVGISPSDFWDYISNSGNNGGASGPEMVYGALLQPEAAASDLTGSITLAGLDTSGSLASNVALLAGDLSVADVLASGALGLVPGSVRTLPFARNNGTRPTGLINVAVAVLSDDASLLRLAGSTAIAQNGDGTISFSGAGLPGVGASVIVITREPDGKIGAERYPVT